MSRLCIRPSRKKRRATVHSNIHGMCPALRAAWSTVGAPRCPARAGGSNTASPTCTPSGNVRRLQGAQPHLHRACGGLALLEYQHLDGCHRAGAAGPPAAAPRPAALAPVSTSTDTVMSSRKNVRRRASQRQLHLDRAPLRVHARGDRHHAAPPGAGRQRHTATTPGRWPSRSWSRKRSSTWATISVGPLQGQLQQRRAGLHDLAARLHRARAAPWRRWARRCGSAAAWPGRPPGPTAPAATWASGGLAVRPPAFGRRLAPGPGRPAAAPGPRPGPSRAFIQGWPGSENLGAPIAGCAPSRPAPAQAGLGLRHLGLAADAALVCGTLRSWAWACSTPALRLLGRLLATRPAPGAAAIRPACTASPSFTADRFHPLHPRCCPPRRGYQFPPGPRTAGCAPALAPAPCTAGTWGPRHCLQRGIRHPHKHEHGGSQRPASVGGVAWARPVVQFWNSSHLSQVLGEQRMHHL